MNFSVLPPEVTSAQMYTGAGSGPLLAAAASWNGLGNELSSAAESFSSITSGVPWQGAAAAAMTAVAAQYAQWLTAAASHAGSTAAQANATAGIFEAARAAITHPTAIMANRTQLLRLVSSNLFGFNAPAIAATEGQYESMWATNVAALSGYHGAASSVVAQLTPWQQALQRLVAPAAAVGSGSPQQQVKAYNQNAVANLKSFAASQLASTQALTTGDLAAAGAALGSGNLGLAAKDVADAGLVNAGTALRLGARIGDFGPQVAGQDLNILGGAGTGMILNPNLASPGITNGSGGLLGNLLANNNSDMDSVLRQNSIRLADTRALTNSDLAAAGAALGKGDFGAAAHDVTDAALINAGTTLQVGARTAFFAPELAGEDLDIAGGGASLLGKLPVTSFALEARGGLLQSLVDNNYDDVTGLLNQNSFQLSATQALTRSDIVAAGAALGTGDFGAAAHDVADAGLINAGTTLRIGAHMGDFGLQVAGEDLNILGGGSSTGVIAKADFASPIMTTGGGSGLLGNLLDNNHADMDTVLRQNSFQLSDTRALTSSDLAAAGAALGKGDFGAAAHDVANAALINAGTTLEVGGRTAFFAPELAGEDLDIAGGLMARQAFTTVAQLAPVQELSTFAPSGLLQSIVDNNYSDTSNLLSQNSYQLSATHALTRSDLAAAATDLGFGNSTGGDTGVETAASRVGLDGMRAAAREVANVGLINAGSAVDVAGRTEGLIPQAAGEDLDLFGGGSARLWIPVEEFAQISPLVPTPHPIPQPGHGLVGTHNSADLASLQSENQYQLSATHALAKSDLAAAATDLALGNHTDLAAAASRINVGAAAREVANAGTISAGSGLDVAGRTLSLAPQLAGEDLDILGGGNNVIPGRLERE